MMTIFQQIIDKKYQPTLCMKMIWHLLFMMFNRKHLCTYWLFQKPIVNVATASAEDKALLGHLMWVCAEIARSEGIDNDGYRLVTNVNDWGGQSVYHLHIHLLGKRQMQWPPG